MAWEVEYTDQFGRWFKALDEDTRDTIAAAVELLILFAFDPRRMAILLIGGDKTNRWQAWYRENIHIADQLYDEHLMILKEEGHLP